MPWWRFALSEHSLVKLFIFFTNDESLTCVIRCYVHLAADADILFI